MQDSCIRHWEHHTRLKDRRSVYFHGRSCGFSSSRFPYKSEPMSERLCTAHHAAAGWYVMRYPSSLDRPGGGRSLEMGSYDGRVQDARGA